MWTAMEPEEIIAHCAELFKQQQLTLAFAESVTAGYLCQAFGELPGCGSFFKGGIVAYDAEVKKDLLGLTQQVFDDFTPESAEVSRAMAHGLKKCIPADFILAITGLNAPGGSESPEKPVGTIFIHVIFKEKEYALKYFFSGNPQEINAQILNAVALFIQTQLRVEANQQYSTI